MTPETYFLAAIVGIMLAGLVIKGWRRILPCLAFCLFLPELKAQGYDNDNDVPTLEDIRDAILAQKVMLEYQLTYINQQTAGTNTKLDTSNSDLSDIAYYAPDLRHIRNTNSDISNYSEDSLEELQVISNALFNNGTSLADIAKANRESNALTQSGVNTLTYSNNHIKNNTADSLTELQDISNTQYYQGDWSAKIQGQSLTELQDISNALDGTVPYTPAWNLSTNTSGSLKNYIYTDMLSNALTSSNTSTTNTLLQNLDQDNDVPAIQSLESLLSGYGQWDTDNDVDAIEAVEAAIDGLRNSNSANFATQHADNINIVNAITALQSSVDSDQASPQAPSITTPELADAPEKGDARNFDTVNNDNGNINDTTIKDTIINDVGEFYVDTPIDLETSHTVNGKPSFFQSATQKRDIVAGSFTLPNVQGSGMASITADINASMQTRMAQATPIVMPIFTGYLLFIIGRWTLDTSNSIIAS